MGSRVTRLIRNFNIENRAHREISKTKPKAAPRHPASSSTPQEGIAGEKACWLTVRLLTLHHEEPSSGGGSYLVSFRRNMTCEYDLSTAMRGNYISFFNLTF